MAAFQTPNDKKFGTVTANTVKTVNLEVTNLLAYGSPNNSINIDAPIIISDDLTVEDLTVTGNTILGNASTDTLTVAATSTFQNNVTLGTSNADLLSVLASSTFSGDFLISNATGTSVLSINRAATANATIINFTTGGIGTVEWSIGQSTGATNRHLLISNLAGPAVNESVVMTLGTGRLAVQGSSGITEGTTPNALNATGVLTAAMVVGGIVTSTTAAAVTATTDTAANIVAAFPHSAVGETKEVMVVNTGANAFTLAAGAGVTLVAGAAAIAATSSRIIKFRFTNVTLAAEAVTLYA